jgi:hypothetical protein
MALCHPLPHSFQQGSATPQLCLVWSLTSPTVHLETFLACQGALASGTCSLSKAHRTSCRLHLMRQRMRQRIWAGVSSVARLAQCATGFSALQPTDCPTANAPFAFHAAGVITLLHPKLLSNPRRPVASQSAPILCQEFQESRPPFTHDGR